MRVLITGGAGFIGSHLTDALVSQGHAVTVFDSLDPRVHSAIPDYLNPSARLVIGDVRNPSFPPYVAEADVVYHLAAVTSIPQSENAPGECISTNVLGTANLLSAMAPGKRLVLASSRAVYGEGRYLCDGCGPVYPPPRSMAQLQAATWDLPCPNCAGPISPTGTDESAPLRPASIYALSKRMQEDLCFHASKVKGFPLTILRYFNIYGPRQSLCNPYTGILSIFTSRLLGGKPIEVYEDGMESRDFIYVGDAVDATLVDRIGIFNVGTGVPTSVLDVANLLVGKLGGNVEVTGAYRVGDIRHCFSTTREPPIVPLSDGLDRLIEWSIR